MEPWPNSYLRSSALDDPLDNPVLQRDSARDLAAVLADRNDAALALHVLDGPADDPDGCWCACCRELFPCRTRRALTGTDSPEVA